MLNTISDARLQSPFILFVGHCTDPPAGRTYVCDSFHPLPDGADSNGSSLFLAILKSYIISSERVTHVLCWERRTLRHLQALEREEPSKLRLHNCLADFHGWINKDSHATGLMNIILKSVPEDTEEINVIVDSLSNPLFTIGFGPCIKEVQNMINSSSQNGPRIHQLMCMTYSDMLPCGPSSLSHLKHLASTVVELRNQVARITHRKPGGHVERKDERYTILPDGQISIQLFRTTAFTESTHVDDRSQTLPQDIASFRVSLSDKEKGDRDKLVLPYTRTADKLEEEGGGKVFYQSDAVDDWDDEDPDDDLDV